MLELFILAFICLAALSFGLKIIGLFLGLLFSSFGFVFRIVVISVVAIFFFPVLLTILGGLFSSGFLAILLVAALLMSIVKEFRRDHRDRREHRYPNESSYRRSY